MKEPNDVKTRYETGSAVASLKRTQEYAGLQPMMERAFSTS